MKLALFSIIVTICVLISGCTTYRSGLQEEGRYSGILDLGFEVSSFTPEFSTEKWWFAGDIQREIKRITPKNAPTTLHNSYWIDFYGTLDSDGNYGHLGAYKRMVTCDKLITIR